MATLVSTGQITIVDNNDAKPITGFITSSGPTQQTYTKDESSVIWAPDWSSAPITLSAKVYVGSTTDVSANLTNKKWSTDLSTSIGTSNTFTVNTNLTDAAPAKIYYFEGDYTDLATGLSSHIICQIQVTLVKTGTNAVYIQVRGQNVIENATGSTKNTVTLYADVIRAAGIDNTGITYKWFQYPHTAADQIDGSLSAVTTKYGFLDTAAVAANVTAAIGVVKTTAAGTPTTLSTTNMPHGSYGDMKAIIIGEPAVTNISIFKVQASDSDGTVYQAFFTVYDISDPYNVILVSSSGDKLQNGIGSTTIFPRVFYGQGRVTDVTSWTFDFSFYDRDGNRGAFIDTTRSSTAGGRNITANTTGASATFTYDGVAITFVAGDIIKCVKSSGVAVYYEVASGSGNTVTIRSAVINTWLAYANPSATTDFVSGKFYVCYTNKTTNGGTTETAAQITVTGDDIDAKGSIFCNANRP